MQDLSIKMYGCEVRVEWTTARFRRLLGEPFYDLKLVVRDLKSVGLGSLDLSQSR